MSTSIFEAMGGYEGAPAGEAQPAKTRKRRRVDEYTLRLTKDQWYILDALAEGAMLSTQVAKANSLCMLIWNDIQQWSHRSTPTSLEKRGLIAKDGILYQLTDAGRRALEVRAQNKPGQL